jgi:hypothetical protein
MTSSLWLRLLFTQLPLYESHHSQFRLRLPHQPYLGRSATSLGQIWSTFWEHHYMSVPTETHLVACRPRPQWVLLSLQSLGDKFLYAWSPHLTQDLPLDLKRYLLTPLQPFLDFHLGRLPLVRPEAILLLGGSRRSCLSGRLPLRLRHLSIGASLLATLAPAASHKNSCQGNLTFIFSALLRCSKDGFTSHYPSSRTKHLQLSLERFTN